MKSFRKPALAVVIPMIIAFFVCCGEAPPDGKSTRPRDFSGLCTMPRVSQTLKRKADSAKVNGQGADHVESR
jgi:hypothetical protein